MTQPYDVLKTRRQLEGSLSAFGASGASASASVPTSNSAGTSNTSARDIKPDFTPTPALASSRVDTFDQKPITSPVSSKTGNTTKASTSSRPIGF